MRNKNTIKVLILAVAFLSAIGIVAASRVSVSNSFVDDNDPASTDPDPAKAVAAFNEAAKVFFSARCANCHPAGDSPTQGDEMTPHVMAVTRGKDGHGVYGQKCSTCHQLENLPGLHMPPGTSKEWHMPPADQKMVFQGLTVGELCRNLKDPKKNGGHIGAAASMEHILKKDPLVTWAWNPGNGRTTPPMSFEEFTKHINDWVANGGACPK